MFIEHIAVILTEGLLFVLLKGVFSLVCILAVRMKEVPTAMSLLLSSEGSASDGKTF